MVWGQTPESGLLWQVSGPALEKSSYVVGTVHSRDARAFTQVPQLLAILQGQDAMVGELDLTEGAAILGLSVQSFLMPTGVDLADLLSPGKYKRVHKAIQAELGPMAVMAGRMKPFFVAALLGEQAMQADSALMLDQYLQEQAKALGKAVLGLETTAEQLAAVDRIPLQEQAELLYEQVRKGRSARDMDRLMGAYLAQDLTALEALVSQGRSGPDMQRELLTGRNATMAARMDSLMQGGRTFLFALGAAHLPGEGGVLELLRHKGYRLEAVDPRGSRP